MTEQTYMSDGPVDSEQAQELREGMVSALQAQGVVRSPEVVAAIRAVLRYVFGPEDEPESAYALWTVLHRLRDATRTPGEFLARTSANAAEVRASAA